MAISFDNARTSLATSLSGAALAIGNLAGCGVEHHPPHPRLPSTIEERAGCITEAETIRQDTQRGIDAATPNAWTKGVDAVTNYRRQPSRVNDATAVAIGSREDCIKKLEEKKWDDALAAKPAPAPATAVPNRVDVPASAEPGATIQEVPSGPTQDQIDAAGMRAVKKFEDAVKLKPFMSGLSKGGTCATERLQAQKAASAAEGRSCPN